MQKNNNSKILVEIPAYKDPELLNTVNSAITQADNKYRVFFAICHQGDEIDDYNELKKIPNCKLIHLSDKESRGACYARYLCDTMIGDEDYIFQIDSHMRFVKHWDTKMIECLLSLNDPKGIITFYPPDFTKDMETLPFDAEVFNNPGRGSIMHTVNFHGNNSYFLRINSYPAKESEEFEYNRSIFLAAGNFFTFSEAHKLVKHDPNMYFYGDELAMSIRLFTYGWNIYNCNKAYVYHQYHRKHQKFSQVDNAINNEEKRFLQLIRLQDYGIDLGEFDIGNIRTIKEFEDYSGIDFKRKIIHVNAEKGYFNDEDSRKQISYLQQKKIKRNQMLKEKNNVEVVIVDLFGEYKRCIEWATRHSSGDNNIKYIVGTTIDNSITDNNNNNNDIKKILYFNKEATYSEILSAITEFLGDSFTAIVDSSVIFLKGWDKYLCDSLKKCGTQSALTSWVWKTDKNDGFENNPTYFNCIKEVENFNNYLPTIKYNENMKFSERKIPYLTPLISDGFLFIRSKVLKKVKIDPNLNYEEQKVLYSARLWTNGIDIYYPPLSYMIRTRRDYELNNNKNNPNILNTIIEKAAYIAEPLLEKYPYELGNNRALWSWYNLLGESIDKRTYDDMF